MWVAAFPLLLSIRARCAVTERSIRLVARLCWFFPALLIFLTFQQGKAAYDLNHTLQNGTEAIAEVTEYEESNRVDVVYDYVSLRIPLEDGSVMEKDNVSLPHTLISKLEGKETLPVLVLPGAAQEVVITEVAGTQSRIAGINAIMALVAFIMAFVLVAGWNRYLARKGDPAFQAV